MNLTCCHARDMLDMFTFLISKKSMQHTDIGTTHQLEVLIYPTKYLCLLLSDSHIHFELLHGDHEIFL